MTAIVVAADPGHSGKDAVEWQRFTVELQREENRRRDRATLDICQLVLMAFVEGRWLFARRLGALFGDSLVENLVADASMPSYTEMRNFLIGELDAHPVIAAQAAFSRTVGFNQMERRSETRRAWYGDGRHYDYGDRGWI